MSSILFHSTRKTKGWPNWRAKRGDPVSFLTIQSVAEYQKIKGGYLLRKQNQKKENLEESHSAENVKGTKRAIGLFQHPF